MSVLLVKERGMVGRVRCHGADSCVGVLNVQDSQLEAGR